MAERAPLPWVLTWDANGELERNDRYDLLLSSAALEKTCALGISPWVEGSDGLPPSCRSHEPCPDPRPPESAGPDSHR